LLTGRTEICAKYTIQPQSFVDGLLTETPENGQKEQGLEKQLAQNLKIKNDS